MAVLLAFFAAVSWGASDFLGGFASKKDNFLTVTFVRQIFDVAIISAIVIFATGNFYWSDFGLGIFGGLVVGLIMPLFYGTLSGGRMAVVAPVAGVVGALVPIVVGLLSGERLSVLQMLGLIFAVASVAFISIQHFHDDEGIRRSHIPVREVVSAVVCGVAFGSYFVILHHTNEDSGYWPLIGMGIGGFTVTFLRLSLKRVPELWTISRRGLLWCFVGVGVDVVANVAFIAATRSGLLSITAGVASLYPVCTAILAFLILRERLHFINVLGLIACVVSLALIAT